MEFKILGPMEVVAGGQPVALGTPKQRLVLAVLLGRPGHPVTVDQLVDALWGPTPPASAADNVYLHIHHLRRSLGADRITGRGRQGYVLRVDPTEIDAHVFVQRVRAGADALAAGDPTRARISLGDALALWRGTPFADLPDEPALREEATRLEEARLIALEHRIEADLRLGQHGEVVTELRELVQQYPFEERFYAQLMLALYRSGRRAEALDVYGHARRIVATELGLEPSPALRDIHSAILAGGQGLDPPRARPAAVPRQLPPGVRDFVGRTAEDARLTDLVTAGSEPGVPPVVVITGEGGVGKTALAVHVGHAIKDRFPDGQLYADLRGPDAEPIEPAEVLSRFLRALSIEGPAIPSSREERAELFRSLVAERRIFILLDNAADEEQVRPLVAGSTGCAVVITSRSRLVGLRDAQILVLAALEPPQSLELLGHVLGGQRLADDPEAAAELVALCGGLPLALQIAAARLAARPHWTVSRLVDRLRDEDHRLDELAVGGLGVRRSLAVSYRVLDRRARRLFRLLGLLDVPDFAGWVAAALLDTDLAEAGELIEHLVEVHLLEVVAHGSGAQDGSEEWRYRFHDLVGVYARELAATHDSESDRRSALSRAFGAWLALAEQSHLRLYAGHSAVLRGEATRWMLAPTATEHLLADPLGWFEAERAAARAVIRQAARLDLPATSWELAALFARSLYIARYYPDDWRVTNEDAFVTAQRNGDQIGVISALVHLGYMLLSEARNPEALALFSRANQLVEQTSDQHAWAQVHWGLAYIERISGHLERAMDMFQQVRAAAHATGDLWLEGMTIVQLSRPELAANRLAEAEHELRQIVNSWPRQAQGRMQALALHALSEIYLHTAELTKAEEVLRQSHRAVQDLGDRAGEAHVLYNIGRVLMGQGRAAEAEPILQETSRVVRDAGVARLEIRALHSLADVAHQLGRDAEAASYLDQALASSRRIPPSHWMVRILTAAAEAHGEAGNTVAESATREYTCETQAELDSRPGGPIAAEPTPVDVPPGRPPDVPVSAGQPAVPAQLPADVANFVGRTAELDRLDTFAYRTEADAAMVVVAIAGTTGVGKTALAVRWAHRATVHFPDGQLFVDLRGYDAQPLAAERAVAYLLEALGVEPERIPTDVVTAAALYRSLLASRRVLVVLDNASSAEQVRPLLPGGRRCLALVTSRDRLGGLIAHEGAHELELGVPSRTDAVELLGRLLGRQRVDDTVLSKLAAACGYLPLALRIAAANLSAEPTRSVIDYVRDLTDGSALAALIISGDESRGVQAAFERSYLALPAAARRLFRLLGLVPGPDFTVVAAAALLCESQPAAAALLDRLATAHLIERREPGRYAFHDLLRSFAADRTGRDDDAALRGHAMQRLLNSYLCHAHAAAALLHPHVLRLPWPPDLMCATTADLDDEAAAVAWLDAERPNLVSATVHASNHRFLRAAWLLADTLRGYLSQRRHYPDMRAVAQAGIAAGKLDRRLDAQASATLSLGTLESYLGRHEIAIGLYLEGRKLAHRAGWTDGEAFALGGLGQVYTRMGRPRQSAETLTEALAVVRRTGRLAGQAVVLSDLGLARWGEGRLKLAAEHYLEAIAIFRQLGSRVGEAIATMNLGETYDHLGRLREAEQLLGRAIELHQETKHPVVEALATSSLAAVHLEAGRDRQALQLAESARTLARVTGDRRYEAEVMRIRAMVYAQLGRWRAASDEYRAALEQARNTGERHTEVKVLIGLADLCRHDPGLREQGFSYAQQALVLACDAGFRMLEGQALTVLGAVRLDDRDPDQAAGYLRQAVVVHRETGHRLGLAWTLVLLARSLDGPTAVIHEQEARAIVCDVGAPALVTVADPVVGAAADL